MDFASQNPEEKIFLTENFLWAKFRRIWPFGRGFSPKAKIGEKFFRQKSRIGLVVDFFSDFSEISEKSQISLEKWMGLGNFAARRRNCLTPSTFPYLAFPLVI